VPANQTYYGWLKTQPAAVQDSIIGPTKGKLLRDGGLSSQRFSELQLGKQFQPLTLYGRDLPGGGREMGMRELEPLAFQRAGLDMLTSAPRSARMPTLTAQAQLQADEVLSSAFSTSQFGTKDTINLIYKNINTTEIAKLQEFIKQKDIRTVIVSERQMSIKTKTSRDIFPQVFNYLESQESTRLRTRLGAGRITNNLYATNRASVVNGFTSSAYNHVVVKNKVTSNVKNHAEIASNMQKLVADYAKLPADNMPWSLSDGMQRIYKSEAGAMSTTLLHELGHQVHYYAGSPQFPKVLNNSRLTKYSLSNSAESHAEHFAAWAINRTALASKSQELAEYFDDLMEKALKSNFSSSRGL